MSQGERMYKWRIYCNTENAWVYLDNDETTNPTECPNNSAHSINPNSVSVYDIYKYSTDFSGAINESVRNPNWQKVSSFSFMGSTKLKGDLACALFSAWLVSGDSFDIRLINATNDTILTTLEGKSNTDPAFIKCDGLSNIPTDPCVLEVHSKVNGTGNKEAYIESVSILKKEIANS